MQAARKVTAQDTQVIPLHRPDSEFALTDSEFDAAFKEGFGDMPHSGPTARKTAQIETELDKYSNRLLTNNTTDNKIWGSLRQQIGGLASAVIEEIKKRQQNSGQQETLRETLLRMGDRVFSLFKAVIDQSAPLFEEYSRIKPEKLKAILPSSFFLSTNKGFFIKYMKKLDIDAALNAIVESMEG